MRGEKFQKVYYEPHTFKHKRVVLLGVINLQKNKEKFSKLEIFFRLQRTGHMMSIRWRKVSASFSKNTFDVKGGVGCGHR